MLALGAVAAAVSPEDRRSNHLLDATTPALSGLLAGLAGCVRKELLLLALPLAVYQALPTGWRATRHWRRLAAWLGAFSLPLLAWWSYTFLHSADVIPPEFRISTQPELSATAYALRVGPAALADFVFDPRYGWLGDLLMVAVAAYGLANFRLPRAGPTAAAGWIREAIQVAALAAVLVGAWRTMAAPLASVSVFGLLSASPFLMLGWSEDTAEALRARALRWIGLSYYALMVLSLGFLTLAGPLQSGLEWGTRFGLLTFPLAAPLSLLALRAVWARARAPGNWLARVHLALAVALIAWSAAWQFAGVSLMRRPAVGAEVRSTLLSLPDDVILTNLWWLSAAVPDLYLSRPTFLTDSDQALREWLAAAQRGGVRGFAFISYVPLSESVAMALAPAGLRVSAAQPFQLVNGMIVTRYTLTPGLPD